MRIFFKAKDSSYSEASLSKCKDKVVSEALEKTHLKLVYQPEYYTSGPVEKEDLATGRIQSCPAEEKVRQIQVYRKILFFLFVLMRNVLMQML